MYMGAIWIRKVYFNWLVQERRNSIANALELRLSCTNPSISAIGVPLFLGNMPHLPTSIEGCKLTVSSGGVSRSPSQLKAVMLARAVRPGRNQVNKGSICSC